MTMIVLALLVVYVVSATLIASMLFAHFQRKFPTIAAENRNEDAGITWLMGLLLGLFGPIGVVSVFMLTGFATHGLKFPRPRG